MASENRLPFDPDKVPDLIKQGKILVVRASTLSPVVPEPTATPNGRFVERAKQLFGEDFLGEEAIHVMEQKCQTEGIDVRFEIPQIGRFDASALHVGLTDAQLETAKADETRGRARLVVLRPEFMVVNGERKLLNLINLRDLFRKNKESGQFAYDNNPFGSGIIFYKQDWYNDQDFAQEGMKAGFGVPTKEVLRDSVSKTWDQQQSLLLPEEKRRESVETAWDTLLYYAVTGKKLLSSRRDWGNTRASSGHLVNVGDFDSNGLHVGGWHPGDSDPRIGVCPSR